MSNKIMIFIPTYNCEQQIDRVLSQFDSIKNNYFYEILVVNNKSKDNTEFVAIEKAKKSHHFITVIENNENYNLGGSHKVAFNYAIEKNYDYVVVLHGDDQGSIHDLIPFINDERYKDYDQFLGSRFMKNSKLIGYSKFRIFGNYIFNFFLTILLRKTIKDLGSGLNMYKVDYLKNKFYIGFPNNLVFNVYMLFYGCFVNAKTTFFPLSWREEDQISNAKLFKQTKEMLAMSFRYMLSKNKFFADLSHSDLAKKMYTFKVKFTNKN